MRYKRVIYGLAILFAIAIFPILWLRWSHTEPCSSEQAECCDMGVRYEDHRLDIVPSTPSAVHALETALRSQPSDILVVVENTVETSKERLTFYIKNVSDSQSIYGDLYNRGGLAICADGRWRPLRPIIIEDGPAAAGVFIPRQTTRIEPGETRKFSTEHGDLSPLSPGRYLFIVDFTYRYWRFSRERIFLEFTIY